MSFELIELLNLIFFQNLISSPFAIQIDYNLELYHFLLM